MVCSTRAAEPVSSSCLTLVTKCSLQWGCQKCSSKAALAKAQELAPGCAEEVATRSIPWEMLCLLGGLASALLLKCFSNFLHRPEKSSALTNKGQSRGLGALQPTGNCAWEIDWLPWSLGDSLGSVLPWWLSTGSTSSPVSLPGGEALVPQAPLHRVMGL